MDRLSDIDEFEEVIKAGVKERSESVDSGQLDLTDILTEIVDNIFDEDYDDDTEPDDDSTPHIRSQSSVSGGREEEVVGLDAQFNLLDSENDGIRQGDFNQEIENLSPSAEKTAEQIGLQSDKSNFSEFSIEGQKLLSEDNITDKQSTESRLDEQSLQQRKSDRNLDVSQERDYQENKTFFGISLGRLVETFKIFYLKNIYIFSSRRHRSQSSLPQRRRAGADRSDIPQHRGGYDVPGEQGQNHLRQGQQPHPEPQNLQVQGIGLSEEDQVLSQSQTLQQVSRVPAGRGAGG